MKPRVKFGDAASELDQVEMAMTSITHKERAIQAHEHEDVQISKPHRRVRSIGCGLTYRVIGDAEAQVSTGEPCEFFDPVPKDPVRHVSDGDLFIVYQCEASGKLFIRFADEFDNEKLWRDCE